MADKITPEGELLIRELLVTDFTAIEEVKFVIAEFRNFAGKEHFASFVGEISQTNESVKSRSTKLDSFLVKYLMVYTDNLTNSAVAGAQYCPNKFIDYVVELFQEEDIKNDEYSSHNEFVKTIIKLDKKFLTGLAMTATGFENLKRSQLSTAGRFQHGVESRRVPGVRGHQADFRIRVEVR